MCETFSVGDLNLVSYSPHSTNNYICRMIIVQRVHRRYNKIYKKKKKRFSK